MVKRAIADHIRNQDWSTLCCIALAHMYAVRVRLFVEAHPRCVPPPPSWGRNATSEIAVGYGSQHVHLAVARDLVQERWGRGSGLLGRGQLLEDATIAAGVKRLSFWPGSSEVTLNACDTFRGT